MVFVLVVDDDATFEVTCKISDGTPNACVHARDPETVLGCITQHPHAVVLTTSRPADRDGFRWITELRRAAPTAFLVAICDTREHALADAGADLILERPVDEATLSWALQLAIAHRRAPGAGGGRAKLLVVEPDPHLAVVMKRWLGAVYDVTIVATGTSAFEQIYRERPDAVLAELCVPDMDASELYAGIAAVAPGLTANTLFMTAGATTSRAREFLAAIPGQTLAKPFDLAQLSAAFARLVSA